MATKTLQELQAEQETIDGRYSIAAKNWAEVEFDPEGKIVTLLERAATAENNAERSANAASTSAGRASTAETNAGNAEVAAVTASGTAETARGAAVEAAAAAVAAKNAAVTASEEAVDKVEGAAQVGENNEFNGVNQFNGVSVFNGAITYEDQDMSHLLTYPIIAQLADAGINPVSAFARTWAEWKALNPNWKNIKELLFYAPIMTGEVMSDASDSGTISTTSCKFISPASASLQAAVPLLSQRLRFYTLKEGISKDVAHCYYMKECYFYAPSVTTFDLAMNAVGVSNLQTEPTLVMHIFTPDLTTIVNKEGYGMNASFYRIGLLKEFSIVAPKLAHSFSFSRSTGGKGGQSCAILRALIDGIGRPATVQTITTLTPSDIENVAELQAAAADKNWEFIFE